jgi:hypothetical protein
MRFPYSSVISIGSGSGEFLLLRRPGIPVVIIGPQGSATYIGLVDTGSDNTIFPKSVADYLGIPCEPITGAANVFGGHRVQLLNGNAVLKLEVDGDSCAWNAALCFYDFPSPEDETVIFGHNGFLDYFTATFDGELGVLTSLPNSELPSTSE